MRRRLIPVVALVFCLAGSAAGQTPPVDGPGELVAAVRVASYNAWLLPFGIADDTDLRREAMGPAILALDPDVVCLQEVWTEYDFEPVADALAGRLPHVATGGGGLAVLSRWPVLESRFDEFPSHTAADFAEWFVGKGWLTVLVDTPAGPLRLVNSHLTFDREEGRLDHAFQLAMLVEALRHATDAPTVLCADLNLRAFEDGAPSAGFTLLQEAGFHDAANAGGTYTGTRRPGTRGGWPRQGRSARWDPDWVLFRGGDTGSLAVDGFRQALDDAETALSDHNLQLVDFTLTPAVSNPAATAATPAQPVPAQVD